MAINNYFNATPVSIDFNAVKQVDSKPAASGFANGNIIFDKTEQQFYQALNGSWIALDFIGDDFTVNKLAFNTAATETLVTGELAWNVDDETVDMHVGDAVTIQLGQEMVYHVINQTGSQIDNGTVVMADGALGASGKIKVVPAIADGSVPAKYIMGVATEDIPNGALGYVTAFGKVRGFNTSSYSSGTVLYASATSSGSFTDTAPSLPNQKVTVAITLDQKSNGNIFVRPTYDDRRKSVSSISNLENVNTSENDVVYLDSGGRSGWFKWDSSDLSTQVFNDANQGIYVAPSGEDGSNGAWVRNFTNNEFQAEWFGNTVNADSIQTAMDLGRTKIPAGSYSIATSLEYQKDNYITGAGKSFQGTIITPTGDFPALKPKSVSPAIDYTKNTFENFRIDADNLSSSYAIEIDDAYLTQYENIWIKDSKNGISLTNAGSITFDNVMIMENSTGTAVSIGDGCRSIKFVACNFEKNPTETADGGVVSINGFGNFLPSADFFGCQIERGRLEVKKGIINWDGGKITRAKISFLPESRDSFLKTNALDGTEILDVGFNNKIEDTYATNVSAKTHQWPKLALSTSNIGESGSEFLFGITAGKFANTSGSSASISISDDNGTLITSPFFDVPAEGLTYGARPKYSYTYFAGVKCTSGSLDVSINNANLFGFVGGENLLTNGTFDASTSGWSVSNASVTYSNSDLVLTPSSTTWGITQNVSNIFNYGESYIVLAKFDGNADLTFGNPADGTSGARKLFSQGVSDVYGDGDTLAMLSFDYVKQSTAIGLGNVNADTPVTVKWIMAVKTGGTPYSEGSWTPRVTGSGNQSCTVSITTARYTKIGRMVICEFDLDVTTAHNEASYLQISPPFQTSNVDNSQPIWNDTDSQFEEAVFNNTRIRLFTTCNTTTKTYKGVFQYAIV